MIRFDEVSKHACLWHYTRSLWRSLASACPTPSRSDDGFYRCIFAIGDSTFRHVLSLDALSLVARGRDEVEILIRDFSGTVLMSLRPVLIFEHIFLKAYINHLNHGFSRPNQAWLERLGPRRILELEA